MSLRRLALTISFSLLSIVSYGQYIYHYHYYKPYSSYDTKGKKKLQRFYISFSLPMMAMDMSANYVLQRPAMSGPSVDTTIRWHRASAGSFGAGWGSSFNISRFKGGRGASSLAMDIGMQGDLYRWAGGATRFSTADSVTDAAFVIKLHLPVCLMLRSGGEVLLSPHPRFLFSAGIGFDPTVSAAKYLTVENVFFKIRSFLMAEVGVHAGIAWKLRCSYYPASFAYFNGTATGTLLSDYTQSGTVTTLGTGSGSVVLSLVILPYSFHWGEEVYGF